MTRSLMLAALVLAAPANAAGTAISPETLAGWNAHVAATEARIDRELAAGRPALPRALEGRSIDVPGGMIQQWRGAIFLAGVDLDALLHALEHPPEHGPHQQDVAALRVLRRRADGLDLYIRMTRRKLVTVTYDTEHRVTFRRHSATRASSRSVATKIAEVGAKNDRGFLWQMNAYWRYEEVVGGVIVELESLTLSRSVPFGLATLVGPIVERVARESVNRTLEHVRRTYGGAVSR